MSCFGLNQTIFNYTREANGSRSIIDNVFTDFLPNDFDSSVVISALSDHHAQLFVNKTSLFDKDRSPKFMIKRIINNENVHCFKNFLKCEKWNEVFSSTNTNDISQNFFNLLRYHFDNAFPLKKVKLPNFNVKNRLKLDAELLWLRDETRRLYYLSKDLENEDSLKVEYRRLKSWYRKMIKEKKADSVSHKIMASSNITKTVWQIVNANRTSRNKGVASNLKIRDSNNILVQDPLCVANTFNKFFLNVANDLDSLSFSSNKRLAPSVSQTFFLTPVTKQELVGIITSLKAKSSAGIDGISSRLLRECYEFLVEPLVYLINSSFLSGSFPDVLKSSTVTPLHKKGQSDLLDNFRPISIISSFSKVIEKAIHNRVIDFFEKHNVIFQHQYGFTKGRATVDAMFHLTNEVVSALDSGCFATSAFIDLSKAFDLVDHKVLLEKLHRMGIRGVPWSWFESYLYQRRQVVKVPFVDDSNVLRQGFSDEDIIQRGVPQGSVLGPLLFLIFVNDIGLGINHSDVCLFADDTSLTVVEKSRESMEMQLFVEANSLLEWFAMNRLQVNATKTALLDFSISKQKEVGVSCLVDSYEVHSVNNVNFLGLKLDKNLNYHDHINKVSKSVCTGIFILRRLSHLLDVSLLISVYYGVVYPHLSYGIQIWGFDSLKTAYLFRLQKRAIRVIFGMKTIESCKEMFRQNRILTLPSLYIFESLLFLKRNQQLFSIASTDHGHNLRNKHTFSIPKHKTSFYKKHLLYNGIKLHNSLPIHLRKEKSYNKFKSILKRLLIEKCIYTVSEFYL